MPAIDYTEETFLGPEEAHALWFEFLKWHGLASAFNLGAGAQDHAINQGIMRLLLKAEEMGLITINKVTK